MAQHTFTVEVRGMERTFTLRPNVTLAMRAWMDRARRSYEASDDYVGDATSDDPLTSFVSPFLRHILTTPDLIAGGLACAYTGNADGVDWFSDVEDTIVEEAVGTFVVHFFTRYAARVSDALTSSRPTQTSSAETP
jgi:hypothetical protein